MIASRAISKLAIFGLFFTQIAVATAADHLFVPDEHGDDAAAAIESRILDIADGDRIFFSSPGAYEFPNAAIVVENTSLFGQPAGGGGKLVQLHGADGVDAVIHFLWNGGSADGIENLAFFTGGVAANGSLSGGVRNSAFLKCLDVGLWAAGNFDGSVRETNFIFCGGGAIAAGGDFYGDVSDCNFIGNNSTPYGGVISAMGDFYGDADGAFSDLGGSLFLSGGGDSAGAAICIGGSGKFGAIGGDVIFAKSGNSTTQDAIHVAGRHGAGSGEHAISIAAVENNTFYLHAPIGSSGAGMRNLVIEINPESSHSGTVLFDDCSSNVYFEGGDEGSRGASLFHGTMVLQNGASFGAEDNGGCFVIQSPAILRICQSQPADSFDSFSGDRGQTIVTSSIACGTANHGPSIIGAGILQINGTVHFVLSPHSVPGSVVLRTTGKVAFGPCAAIDVGVASCDSDCVFSFEAGQSLVLLETAGGLEWDGYEAPFACNGSSMGDFVLPGPKFSVALVDDRLVAEFLGVEPLPLPIGIEPSNPEPQQPPNFVGTEQPFADVVGAPDEDLINLFRAAMCEGHLAGMVAVNRCGDLAAGTGIECAVDAARRKNGRVTPFGTLGWSTERHRTGSYVDLRGPTLLVGAAYGTEKQDRILACGTFFECANGNSRTKNNGYDENDIGGNGRCSTMGGGVLARMEIDKFGDGGPNAEFSVRTGTVKNRWSSATFGGYDCNGTYFGAHVGGGYAFEIHKTLPVNVYGKYIFASVGGEKRYVAPGEEIEFLRVKSNRLRLGGRIASAGDGAMSPWCDVYFERELSGETGLTGGLGDKWPPSLNGNCVVGKLGLSYAKKSVTAELSINGSAGTRSGFGYNFRIGGEF